MLAAEVPEGAARGGFTEARVETYGVVAISEAEAVGAAC